MRLFGPEAGLGTAGRPPPGALPGDRPPPRCPPPPAATSAAAREARAAYQRALEALRGGDFGASARNCATWTPAWPSWNAPRRYLHQSMING